MTQLLLEGRGKLYSIDVIQNTNPNEVCWEDLEKTTKGYGFLAETPIGLSSGDRR